MKFKHTLLILSLFIALPANAAVNLNVPFTPQAPFADWREPWQNACEETSILMTDFFYKNKAFDKYIARDQILAVLRIKNKHYGWSLDENVDTLVSMINNFLPWEAYIADNPSLSDIKQEIDNDKPVIMPVYGKKLLNPHFKNGGPPYHMFVISGYDDNTREFITQEPGTRYGLDFRYPYARILDAMHDFLPGNTINGRKVAIFTNPDVIASANTDGDKDGLLKHEELKYRTSLTSIDTDGDGYLDKEEVDNEYSPIVAEKDLGNGDLIKTADSPKVYVIENGFKRHILDPDVFNRHGYDWGKITTISNKYANKFVTGTSIVY